MVGSNGLYHVVRQADWNLLPCLEFRYHNPKLRNRQFTILTIFEQNGQIGGISSVKGMRPNSIKMLSKYSQMFFLWNRKGFLNSPDPDKILGIK